MELITANFSSRRRMFEILRDGLESANQIDFAVSFLRHSGLGLLLEHIRRFSERGGRGRILASTYLGITQPEALRALCAFQSIECRLHLGGFLQTYTATPVTGFHTKFYIFKSHTPCCWVGSSNLTKGGLETNIEANLFHAGHDSVLAAENLFEELWRRDDVAPITERLLIQYEEALRSAQLQQNRSRTALLGTVCVLEQPEEVQPNAAQLEALIKLKGLRESGESRAAIIAAPGVGKTFLAAFDARQAQASSILFLSHRLEHLSQAQKTFQRVFGSTRSYGRVLQGLDQSGADFVFATIQSADHSPTLRNRSFDYVVIDEFHHADAPSYREIIRKIPMRFMLGLTATPERQDGHDVLHFCDFNVAYEVRLIEAIGRGWLLPFHYFGVSDKTVDYSSIPWRSGRFDYDELENALMLDERVEEILRHSIEKGFDGSRRATVCFCAGIRHAKFMAARLNERGQNAVAVTSEIASLEEREEIYRRFQDPNDPLEWLCVSDVLNEGVDLPGINSLIFLRPTESRTLFIQQLGRGLRLTPDCEVLTVIDFVGHHRTAWLPLSALNDADAGTTSSSISELNFTPPKNCQVILDDLTLEILIKVRRSTETKREACLHAYLRLREQSDRPYPLDLWGRQDVPEFEVFRASYKSWILLRIAANHAAPWEKCLLDGDKAYDFLLSLERDWQQPRVYAYALVWGLVAFPNNDPDLGYDEFFNRFARWRVEYKPLNETKAFETVKKKLGGFLKDKALDATIWEQIPGELLVKEVEGRIRLTLEKDYKLRHGGILRSPADLVLHRRYDRPEIINHFGVQYDPAKHNSGFITLNKEIIIITKIDTSGATQRHQYQNKFCDNHTFEWQSQNQQRQDNLEGRAVLEHRQNGDTIHLFVQPRSHEKAYYCGKVAVIAADGNGPMNVTLEFEQGLSEGAFKDLRSPVVRSIASMTNPAAGRQSMNPDDSGEMGLPVMLPFYPIRVAAGGFESGDAPGPEGFVNVAKFGFKPAVPDGLFVTRVVGKSMEPTIPSGNLCVFRNEVVGSREGRVLIVEQRRISDPETGGSYTVKRYRSKKVAQEDGWRHEVIELVPDNKEYPVIKLDATEEDTVRVIGELVFVLPVDAVVGESSTAT